MDIFNILKGFIGAITAIILSMTGHMVVPPTQEISAMASTTDAIIQQVSQTATTTESNTYVQAYELGKSVGALQERIKIADEASTTTAPATHPNPVQIISQPITTMTDQNTTTVSTPVQAPAPVPMASAPISLARIEIISPIPTKGLGREYIASDSIKDESNYIELGALVYDASGNIDKTAVVTISATDSTQNKVENGTGDILTSYPNGQMQQVYGYVFHYEFKTPGKHTVTFSANGVSASVDVNVK